MQSRPQTERPVLGCYCVVLLFAGFFQAPQAKRTVNWVVPFVTGLFSLFLGCYWAVTGVVPLVTGYFQFIHILLNFQFD